MDKSPLLQRQKLDEVGTSLADVIEDQEVVVHIRKTIGKIVVEPKYSHEIFRFQKKLTRLEVELSNLQSYEVPGMDLIFRSFRTLSKELDETVKRISKHIHLLTTLKQMKNCPIAKIVEEI